MRRTIILCLILLSVTTSNLIAGDVPLEKEAYLAKRSSWIERDREDRRSSELILDSLELAADRMLEKMREPWDTLATWQFPPAHRFHEVRSLYDQSPLLAAMDALPKAAMLHAHPSATGSFDILIEATYDPHVYINEGTDELPGKLTWADRSPGRSWSRVIDLRALSGDPMMFDKKLRESITLGLEDYGVGDIWDHFEGNFQRMWDLEASPAVWQPYMLNTCRELAEQHVQYVEFHTWIGAVPRADGSIGTPEETIQNWMAIRDSIRVEYPHFNMKMIGATSRRNSPEAVRTYLRTVVDLKQKFPEFVVGYDLVSEEDKQGTNLYFIDALLDAHRYADSLGVELRPCIHSGESNRLDNENLFDALLLDAKRIGHGYALWTHPSLMRQALSRDVAIEICPLSNQALGYVVDLRNHPAVEYLARGVPIVLSPDDPGMMGYRWAYDWVAATSAWSLSIADIKQLLLDSLTYSGMTDQELSEALIVWYADWAVWLERLAGGEWK